MYQRGHALPGATSPAKVPDGILRKACPSSGRPGPHAPLAVGCDADLRPPSRVKPSLTSQGSSLRPAFPTTAAGKTPGCGPSPSQLPSLWPLAQILGAGLLARGVLPEPPALGQGGPDSLSAPENLFAVSCLKSRQLLASGTLSRAGGNAGGCSLFGTRRRFLRQLNRDAARRPRAGVYPRDTKGSLHLGTQTWRLLLAPP